MQFSAADDRQRPVSCAGVKGGPALQYSENRRLRAAITIRTQEVISAR
jgi:hypothetical protein